MPLRLRVMPDCVIFTTQNTRELYDYANNDTGDV